MQFLEIENDIITNIYDSENIEKIKNISKKEIIQAEGDIEIGDNIKCFDIKNNTLIKKDLNELVKNGIIKLEKNQKIENNKIVEKSKYELYKEGLIEIDKKFKINENNLIEKKTKKELFEEDLIKIEEFKEYLKEILNNYYRKIFLKTDEIYIIREKRKILNMWDEKNENDFISKLKDYEKKYKEYLKIKKEIEDEKEKNNLLNFFEYLINLFKTG